MKYNSGIKKGWTLYTDNDSDGFQGIVLSKKMLVSTICILYESVWCSEQDETICENRWVVAMGEGWHFEHSGIAWRSFGGWHSCSVSWQVVVTQVYTCVQSHTTIHMWKKPILLCYYFISVKMKNKQTTNPRVLDYALRTSRKRSNDRRIAGIADEKNMRCAIFNGNSWM